MYSFLLGYDIGSSSIKAALMDAVSGQIIVSAVSPKKELPISAPQPGWAEQHPDIWWENIVIATKQLTSIYKNELKNIKAIGISYQMHGLVMIDKNLSVLHPAIIWCDSRAVDIGNKAFNEIGKEKCLSNLLNSPGNFTASKLYWVKNNLPEIYDKIYKIMLPGDYIAFKMTGEIVTTPSGLSEGILWNYKENNLAKIVLEYFGISRELIPDIVPTFSVQGTLSSNAAEELGLTKGIPISYRAGDQPNNALSLNVLKPGEIAATAGTSGVVYGVGDKANYDEKSRVNTFVHVNHSEEKPRYGTLLCINGTGILNSWIKHNFMTLKDLLIDYNEMNELAAEIPVGCDGLSIIPFGNGAERSLENLNIQSSINNINFNIHTRAHILRAAQEGIVFAFKYGIEIMHDIGIQVNTVKAGFANMFLSPVFAEAFACTTNAVVELYNTDGSGGAARGAGIGIGIYKTANEAFAGLQVKRTVEPVNNKLSAYTDAYENWKQKLEMNLINNPRSKESGM